jgi:hypothetical protein
MGERKYLDGETLREGILRGYENLIESEEEINRINVFPLPDNDTGTNLRLTLKEAVKEIESADDRLPNILSKVARSSLFSAQGNSGIILSQFFIGLLEGIGKRERVDGETLSRALKKAVSSAYSSMEDPKEGTILTVMRAFEEGFREALKGEYDIAKLFEMGLENAEKALEETPKSLKELEEAGVVDAGGLGFVLFIRGFTEAIKRKLWGARFEVQVTLRSSVESDKIREKLRGLGESLSIASFGDSKRIHIHTDSPDDVIKLLEGTGEIEEKIVRDLFST